MTAPNKVDVAAAAPIRHPSIDCLTTLAAIALEVDERPLSERFSDAELTIQHLHASGHP